MTNFIEEFISLSGGKMKKVCVLVLVISLLLLVAACQYQVPTSEGEDGPVIIVDDEYEEDTEDENGITGETIKEIEDEPDETEEETSEEDTEDEETDDEEAEEEETDDDEPEEEIEDEETGLEDDIDETSALFTIKGVEGDLMNLAPQAVDPDGDMVDYEFSEPFNNEGFWQTNIGDKGKYLVTVTASDGELSTTENVLVIIEKANVAPKIECPEEINVKEGDEVFLDCNIFDEEGDNVVVQYSGWMNSASKITDFGDAGEHSVVIVASDNKNKATVTIIVNVDNVNRAPELDRIRDIEAMEDDIITLEPEASDLDEDELTFTFPEPFDDTGVWKTEIGDAGVYEMSVVVSDGTSIDEDDFTLTIKQKNTAPVLKAIAPIVVEEGDLIELPIDAADREGDELILTVTGWMSSSKYQTTFDDEGEYDVTVSVSDGEFVAVEDVEITVLNKNRPPIFQIPG